MRNKGQIQLAIINELNLLEEQLNNQFALPKCIKDHKDVLTISLQKILKVNVYSILTDEELEEYSVFDFVNSRVVDYNRSTYKGLPLTIDGSDIILNKAISFVSPKAFLDNANNQ